jgi:hypothetical protein
VDFQDLYLALVICAFAVFALGLFGVALWAKRRR